MAVAMIGPKFYAWDRNGKPLAFGKLYTSEARTNIPKPTYQSEDQVVENTNPVILNGEGYANVYLSGRYKMVLKDKDENEIWSSDPVSSNVAEEWTNCVTASYLSPTTFKLIGNFTDSYEAGRKIRLDSNATEFDYSVIVSSSYGGGETTVTVATAVVKTGLEQTCVSVVGPESSFNKEDAGNYSGYTFKTVADMKSGTTNDGRIIDVAALQEGTKIHWMGYDALSDGGSNWGVVRKGAHTEDGFEIFSLGAETYVQANIVGTNNPMMAGLFGGDTDVAKIQNLIDKSTGKVKFGYEQTYDFDAGWFINGNGKELDLNGSTMNFTTETFSIYDKGNNNSVVNGVILTDYTLGSGGNGHAGSCITVGEQSTGNGQYGFTYKKLELTTNRTDAGAHISIIGGCHNFLVTKIKIRDNAVCRNLIGIEWGGTPAEGTQHPHNGKVSKIKVGKITTPTYGSGGFAYVVWCSSAFNISVSSIDCEEAYGLMMCIAGDNSNTYAPDEYKELVGTGISLKNAGILACYGYALRSVGKGGNTPDQIPCNLKAKGIKAVGKKVGANNNFGLQTEFSDGVHLEDFSFTGVWAGGSTTGSDAKNLLIENGEITGCELYGSSVGSGSVKSIKPTIRRVNYYKNNTLGGIGSGTSAVVVNASDDAVVEFCNFGKEGDTETQRYSVYTDAAANRPKVMHNHTYVNDNPAINPYLNGSATVYDENNTKDS